MSNWDKRLNCLFWISWATIVQLFIIGTHLCNVLTAWATLHKPLLSPPGQSLSLPPPQNKNKWIHPVIFEPQPKIQLTQSSYKVAFFLDYQPISWRTLIILHIFRDLYIRSNPFRSPPYWTVQLSKNPLTQKYVDITLWM